MLFRMRWETLGGHTHVRVFAGQGTFTLGKCGDLTFRNEEWEAFQKNLFQFMRAGSDIEIVPEQATPGASANGEASQEASRPPGLPPSVCNCAATPPTMPEFRQHHMPTCPCWVIENAANVQQRVAQPITMRASTDYHCEHGIDIQESWCSRCGTGELAHVPALHAELSRLRTLCSKQDDEISQIAGKALGYPWYKDDQKNFPETTEESGVCVGDHIAESIVQELANRYTELRAVAEAAKAFITNYRLGKPACISDIESALQAAGYGDRFPDNETLKRQIISDPDDDPSAGNG